MNQKTKNIIKTLPNKHPLNYSPFRNHLLRNASRRAFHIFLPLYLFILSSGIVCIFQPSSMTYGANTLLLLKKIPHPSDAYSEGLDYAKGFLWNTLPKKLLKIDPANGDVVASWDYNDIPNFYSESIKWVSDTLWELSFSSNHIYTIRFSGKKVHNIEMNTTPDKTAWGIESIKKNELITTGHNSSTLHVYSIAQKKWILDIPIQTPSSLDTTQIKGFEDLAWDGKYLWSSSFTSHRGEIFAIDLNQKSIVALYTIPEPEMCPIIDGLAISTEHGKKGIWITGKNCPSIYFAALPVTLSTPINPITHIKK